MAFIEILFPFKAFAALEIPPVILIFLGSAYNVICKGISCISAYHPLGAEKNGVYYYHNDGKELDVYLNYFQTLLDESHYLIKIIPYNDISEKPMENDLTVIQSSFPLCTMPKKVAEEFDNEKLFNLWHFQNDYFKSLIEGGGNIKAYINSPGFSDKKVRVDYAHKEIYYSEEQYKKHFSELKRLNKLYEGFSFYVLDNLSF